MDDHTRDPSVAPPLGDPTAIEGWRITLDDARPTAYDADFAYAAALD